MRAALLAVLALASCQRAPDAPSAAPARDAAAGWELARYDAPSGAFSALAPAAWPRRGAPLGPGVTFLGPGTTRFPRSVSIGIARYPNAADTSADPCSYQQALSLVPGWSVAAPCRKRVIGGREVVSYAFKRPLRPLHADAAAYPVRQDVAAVLVPGGFYRIDHTAPAEIYMETLPVFEAVVASFKAGPEPRAP